jgi:hypothetical protein
VATGPARDAVPSAFKGVTDRDPRRARRSTDVAVPLISTLIGIHKLPRKGSPGIPLSPASTFRPRTVNLDFVSSSAEGGRRSVLIRPSGGRRSAKWLDARRWRLVAGAVMPYPDGQALRDIVTRSGLEKVVVVDVGRACRNRAVSGLLNVAASLDVDAPRIWVLDGCDFDLSKSLDLQLFRLVVAMSGASDPQTWRR